MTTRIHSLADVLDILGLSAGDMQQLTGMRGYRDRLYYGGINVHYNGRDDMGVWVEMSGTGCRTYEGFGGDFMGLMSLVVENNGDMNLTRLDVAYDDKVGVVKLGDIAEALRGGEYVSRWRDWQVIDGTKGMTINLGSKTSDVLFRIYNKAVQQGVEGTWIRYELQMRDERAFAFARKLVEGQAIGQLWAGIVRNYVRFVDPGQDTNKWRWMEKSWWQDLLGDAEKIRIYEVKGEEYNADKLDRYIGEMAGAAIDAYIRLYGVAGLISRVKGKSAGRSKYEDIVKVAQRMMENVG